MCTYMSNEAINQNILPSMMLANSLMCHFEIMLLYFWSLFFFSFSALYQSILIFETFQIRVSVIATQGFYGKAALQTALPEFNNIFVS